MESDDGTPGAAKREGATVVPVELQPIVELTRSRALEATTGDWLLILDADELLQPTLADKLRLIADEGRADAVRLPYANFLFGAQARHGSSAPAHDRHWRFFRRGALVHRDEIHTEPTLADGACGLELPYEPGQAIVHFNVLDTAHYLSKLERYTRLEAEHLVAQGRRFAVLRMFWAMAREVLIRLVLRSGWRDGWRGWHQAALMVVYRYLCYVRVREMEDGATGPAVADAYARIAEEVLSGVRVV